MIENEDGLTIYTFAVYDPDDNPLCSLSVLGELSEELIASSLRLRSVASDYREVNRGRAR